MISRRGLLGALAVLPFYGFVPRAPRFDPYLPLKMADEAIELLIGQCGARTHTIGKGGDFGSVDAWLRATVGKADGEEGED